MSDNNVTVLEDDLFTLLLGCLNYSFEAPYAWTIPTQIMIERYCKQLNIDGRKILFNRIVERLGNFKVNNVYDLELTRSWPRIQSLLIAEDSINK